MNITKFSFGFKIRTKLLRLLFDVSIVFLMFLRLSLNFVSFHCLFCTFNDFSSFYVTSLHGSLLSLQIDARDSLGRSALYLTCSEGHLTVANLLLTENANLEAADEAQVTPLMAACASGHTSVVLHLVSLSAQLDKKDVNGQNALFHAAKGERL